MLQFDPAEITALAARYQYDDDGEAQALGATAAARGFYTREEFLTVCAWKTKRSKSKAVANPDAAVEEQTRASFAADDEGERMDALISLEGVGVPTASTLLQFAFPDRYPILDVRALEALGQRGRSVYSVSYWLSYLEECRRLAVRVGVSIRTLDKALWQWSKERG